MCAPRLVWGLGFAHSSPVAPRLGLEEVVKPPHLVGRDGEAREVAVHGTDFLNESVQRSFALLPDFVRGPPEDDHRVVVHMLQELVEPAHHPEHAGVSYHPEGGLVPHVGLVPRGGSVVHANHTLGTIDLRAGSCAQDVAGARDQCTGTAMKAHILGKTGHKQVAKLTAAHQTI